MPAGFLRCAGGGGVAALTPEEKSAGKLFRDSCALLLAEVPSEARCSTFTVWYRHACRDDGQGSTWGMRLRQHYWTSPEYQVEGEWGKWKTAKPVTTIPAGRFAFIFRWGRCSRCGLMVRSGAGRFVIAADSPPEKGAVVERQPANRPVPANQEGAQAAP